MIPNKIYRGNTEISKAYLNGQIVYSSDGVPSFVATYQIDDISEPLTLPVNNDYEIDWGDGVTTTTGNQHFYTSIGVKTVKMYGEIDDFRFNNSGDKDKILTVENWGEFWFRSGGNFYGCSNLSFCQKISPQIQITAFNRVFQNTPNLSIDLSEAIIIAPLLQFSFENSGVNSDIVINSTTRDLIRAFKDAGNFNGVISGDASNIYRFSSFLQNALSFNNDSLKDLDYSSAERIDGFMSGKTATDFNYQYLDNLYNKWAFGDPVTGAGKLNFTKLTNLTTNLGTIQYSSAGATARAFLVSEGLIITDGGNNGL